MKAIKSLIILFVTATFLISCGNSVSNQPATEKGFTNIEKELKSKFGDQAYYTDVSITYNESVGNIIGVTVTEAPESLKMGQWNLMQGNWEQHQDITLEVPNGTKAADFMFQLDDQINLSKLGSLVETSQKALKEDKKIENSSLHMAAIKFPKNGDVSKTEYLVMLKPENGGTTFTYSYKLNGELIKMDY